MTIDKATDVIRYLLRRYASRMELLTKEISDELNASDHIEFKQLASLVDEKTEEYAMLEHKSMVLRGFLTQLLSPTGSETNLPPVESPKKD